MRTSCTTLPGRAASTQAHEGRNQWFQQRPRITDMGRLRAEGAWNRWFHQRPRSNDQGAASNCEICTEASGTEQFLQAGVYFFFNYGIAICADSRLSGFAKNINVEKHQRLKHS